MAYYKICKVCDKEFETRFPFKLSCSPACAYLREVERQKDWWKKNREKEMARRRAKRKTCLWCRLPMPSRRVLYCSDAHRDDALKANFVGRRK